MASKEITVFICSACNQEHPKWSGQCKDCKEWNTLEETTRHKTSSGQRRTFAPSLKLVGLKGQSEPRQRFQTGIGELDRVLGGGAVAGSTILISGDPGIGKSTLLLQAAAALSIRDVRIAYVSGEESIDQIRLRAARLGLENAPVQLDSSTDVEAIQAAMQEDIADVFIVDSIQTMRSILSESSPGTVGQVRTSAQILSDTAMKTNTVLILVGHVTKDGAVAGPKLLEHLVDCVLSFDDSGQSYRILRTTKNRFGATDEIGVFEMQDAGLVEILNPSAAFLAERRTDVSGSAVFSGIEGTRPILAEVQALIAPTAYSAPRRTVVGYDGGRISMMLAVLESRCGVALSQYDLYINVAGGLRITEPAADLAVAAAILSALSGDPCPADKVYFGEVGLTGEIRSVQRGDARVKEALKLGFSQAVCPRQKNSSPDHLHEMRDLNELVETFKENLPDRPTEVAIAAEARARRN